MKPADLASIAPKDRAVSIAPVKIAPRICSVCKCADYTTVIEGEYDPLGNQLIRHHVTIELRYLKTRQDCTPHLESKGWRHKMHQARNAMERFICRPCLMNTREMSTEFKRKRDSELGQKNHDPYYMALCGEN